MSTRRPSELLFHASIFTLTRVFQRGRRSFLPHIRLVSTRRPSTHPLIQSDSTWRAQLRQPRSSSSCSVLSEDAFFCSRCIASYATFALADLPHFHPCSQSLIIDNNSWLCLPRDRSRLLTGRISLPRKSSRPTKAVFRYRLARPSLSRHHRIPKLLGDHRRNSLSSVGSASLIPPSATHSSTHTSQNRRRLYSSASYTSTTSRSTVGLPHGPHSQVKIVLPAPLALTASDTGSSINIRPPVPADHWQNQGSIRLSVADMWAPTLHRTTSSDHIVPASTRPRGRLSKSASPSRQRTRLAQSASSNNVSRAPSPLNSEPLE
ncbi:hypothetical protein V8B97DRAFT_895906 [Scleroderma yunnanense]